MNELLTEAEQLLERAVLDLRRNVVTRSLLFTIIHNIRHAAALLGRLDQDMAKVPPPKEGE